MSSLNFSISKYQEGLRAGQYSPPAALCPYYEVDPVLFRAHGKTDQRRGKLCLAVEELRKRTDKDYFDKTYPLQARTLDYSARSFPAYRFILPEVMTEDWLAIVDWGKFQRDHVLHQPLCGYIVLRLLDGDDANLPLCLPDGKQLLDACIEKILRWEETAYIRDFLIGCGMSKNDPILDAKSRIAPSVWRIFFREAAYVAAVFHDLGYPWQYAERIQYNLDGMNTTSIRQNRSAEQIYELFRHRLLFYMLQGYQAPDCAHPSNWHEKIIKLTDTALTATHGFLGALGFLYLNDCIRRYPAQYASPLHLLCVEWVAGAIMMHDMSKIYWGKGETESDIPKYPFLRLSFDRDPLSTIVTLADVIQDFERPAATFGICADRIKPRVTLEYDPGCVATDLILDGNILTIRYKMTNKDSWAIKQMTLPKERREFFDTQYGYLDMSSMGIDKVQLFADII
jgi:hypothetical protein